MILIEIPFKPFIPSTILGLLGLISGYLYFYLKNKNNNKLKEIQSTNSKDRLKAIEVYLNELGVSVDTKNLSPSDKLKLLQSSLKAKTTKYIIIALTAIIISGLVTFLVWSNIYQGKNSNLDSPSNNDSLSKPKTIVDSPDLSKKEAKIDTISQTNGVDQELKRKKSEFRNQLLAIKREAQLNKDVLENSFRKYFDKGRVLNEFTIHTITQYWDKTLFVEFATEKQMYSLRRYINFLKLSNQYKIMANNYHDNNDYSNYDNVVRIWGSNLDSCELTINEVLHLK